MATALLKFWILACVVFVTYFALMLVFTLFVGMCLTGFAHWKNRKQF